jgi:hypothetical protein
MPAWSRPSRILVITTLQTSLPFLLTGLSDRRRRDIAGSNRQNFNQITMLLTYVRTRAEKEKSKVPPNHESWSVIPDMPLTKAGHLLQQ